ncbi:MAG: Histidinol-phosphatase [Firmicutes bacterium ADurb.Bin300]|nr:MAG: Histidinol-phosphatase [Firmicutes bacterium ADurb.Bin300]
MDYQRIIDSHVHSDNSPDGHHSVTFMCETAVSKNLRAIAFTDHCEIDVFYEDGYDRRIRQSYFETAKIKNAFLGSLLVLQGIELAQPHYNSALADTILSAQRYDTVIGSVHNLRGEKDFYYIKSFDGYDIPAVFNEYLDELLAMTDWGNFDVLAHMTYPFRYFFNVAGIDEDINNYKAKTDELLKLLAEKDKAIEINTGGLRQKINKTSPELNVVKRFKQLGGKYISVGSDAHYAEQIGYGIATAYETALEAGFSSVVMFQNRTPMEISIG